MRFRTIHILLVTLLVALAFGWIVDRTYLRRAIRGRDNDIAALHNQLHGLAAMDLRSEEDSARLLSLTKSGFAFAVEPVSAVADGPLADLRELSKLHCYIRRLYIPGGVKLESITEHVPQLKRLEVLSIQGINVGSRPLRFLEKLPRLERLELRNVDLRNESLKHLARVRTLRFLDLSHNLAVTDAVVDSITSMKQLQELRISGTGITKGATKRLRSTLPNCRTVD